MGTSEFYNKVIQHRQIMRDFSLQELEDTLDQRILLITDEGLYVIEDGGIERELTTRQELITYLDEAVGLVTMEKAERRDRLEEQGKIRAGQTINHWDFMEKWDSPMIKLKMKVTNKKTKAKIIKDFASLGVMIEIKDKTDPVVKHTIILQKLADRFYGVIPADKFLVITADAYYMIVNQQNTQEIIQEIPEDKLPLVQEIPEDSLPIVVDLLMGETQLRMLAFREYAEKQGLIEAGGYVNRYPFMEQYDSHQLPVKILMNSLEQYLIKKELFSSLGVWLGENPFLDQATSYQHLKLLELFDGDIPVGEFLLITDTGFYIAEDKTIKRKLASEKEIWEYLTSIDQYESYGDLMIQIEPKVPIAIKVKDPQIKESVKGLLRRHGICY